MPGSFAKLQFEEGEIDTAGAGLGGPHPSGDRGPRHWPAAGCAPSPATRAAAALRTRCAGLVDGHALPLYRMLGHLACRPAATRALPEVAALLQEPRDEGECWGVVGWLLPARTQHVQGPRPPPRWPR